MPSVLVVDNNEDSRRFIKFYLEICGCEVIEADSGEMATRLAQELRPQLILMDLMMPHLDGFDTTRQIRKLEGMSEVPIIVLSSYVYDVEIKQRAMKEGATDCLVKPNDIGRLKSIVKQYLSAA